MTRADVASGTEQGFEDVSQFTLDEAARERLFKLQNECVVCWSTQDGWPMGMPHNYVWAKGRFWVTSTSQRKRITALRARPKSCIVVSEKGTDIGPNQMVAAKTLATVHDDRETLEWFLPLFIYRIDVGRPKNDREFEAVYASFDTPRRIVVEFDPVRFLSFDGHALHAAMAAET